MNQRVQIPIKSHSHQQIKLSRNPACSEGFTGPIEAWPGLLRPGVSLLPCSVGYGDGGGGRSPAIVALPFQENRSNDTNAVKEKLLFLETADYCCALPFIRLGLVPVTGDRRVTTRVVIRS
jgi:hypothetical protein